MKAAEDDHFMIKTMHELAERKLPWLALMTTSEANNALIRVLDDLGFDMYHLRADSTYSLHANGTDLPFWMVYRVENGVVKLHEKGGKEFPELLRLLSNSPTKEKVEELWRKPK